MAEVTARLDAPPNLKAMVDAFIAESYVDPDLAAASEDYRKGYAQGFEEAIYAAVKLMAKRHG